MKVKIINTKFPPSILRAAGVSLHEKHENSINEFIAGKEIIDITFDVSMDKDGYDNSIRSIILYNEIPA
jgi:hypothetical protein